ncbi:outer membrane transport energization protein TonB [Draconibacterium orientale]|jgi:protein TonB|uniref:Energy transducer TonB n=1 Tax=Draconibacterium orientale TaxID=1168034 RepID=X5DB00_9BACT|nr:energy transducer TonB [Draconibacterium orientale]AHW59988.1 energy transducer TonB [Draconibacterium orientale]SET39112.1 outer membrane transport energization protein TonB [Draconibacterium orientale]
MELKKTPKADLEAKKNMFWLIGLVVALGLSLLAFEWTTKPSKAADLGQIQTAEVEEEIIPITREQEVKPPPPPPPPKVIEVLNIVDDDVEIEDELEIEDTEADEETVIDVAPVIETVEEEEEEEAQVFFIVEDMPEFPGGDLALRKYIANAIKYPVIAQENGIQGKVYVTFVVSKTGKVTDAKIARGVDPSLDKEALRVVNALPAWKPGKQRGKPVNVSYTVPINFVLQ